MREAIVSGGKASEKNILTQMLSDIASIIFIHDMMTFSMRVPSKGRDELYSLSAPLSASGIGTDSSKCILIFFIISLMNETLQTFVLKLHLQFINRQMFVEAWRLLTLCKLLIS